MTIQDLIIELQKLNKPEAFIRITSCYGAEAEIDEVVLLQDKHTKEYICELITDIMN